MDKRNDDLKSGKSQNSDMNACGCGGGTGTGYAASDSMNKASASSMQDKSSNQFQNQGYKGSESMNMDNQKDRDNIQGKTCKSGQSGRSGMNDDVVYIETITAVYGPDDLDDMNDQDMNRRLNEDSEDLTDM